MLVVITLCCLSATQAPALADRVTAPELKAPGARVLSRAEVERLVHRARITSPTDGTVRTWTNEPAGFIASSAKGGARPVKGKGRSHITEDGAYCVDIEWPRSVESWCRRIYVADNRYYGLAMEPDEASALSFQVEAPNVGRISQLGTLALIMARTASALTSR
jgi:hypothetical protein